MRLNRFLAAAGFGSRRACDDLIASGAVTINGRTVEKLATLVGEGDEVRCNGRIARAARLVYLLLNKPKGYVVSRADELGRRTVFDLLPAEHGSLFHVGRLDRDSEGLLILTNDGELAQRLTHPAHEVEKEYEVTLDKAFPEESVARLLRGFHIEGGRARMERVRHLAPKVLRVVLRQGLKRQIRLMFYDMGFEVERLVRVRIGSLKGTGLPVGHFRLLTPAEIESLRVGEQRPMKPSGSGKSPAGAPKNPAKRRSSARMPDHRENRRGRP
ncbi:MAG: pseudouridine synthase [Terrimicrobiaceae bacterium]|nr:pseudouridine synthase [Terrimicrobiaceae bacterium]